MTQLGKGDASPTVAADVDDQMATYGITRVAVDYFHFGEFRYSSLADAVAEARRQQPETGRKAVGLP